MNVNFEKIDNVNATLTISIVEDDYKSEVKKRLTRYGEQRPLRGFRPGHVPMGLLQKYYGPQATTEVVDRLVSEAAHKYINENKLHLLGEPMLNADTRIDINKEKDFDVKFDLGLAPEFSITADKKISIPYYKIEVTQKMIDDQNERYRERYGKQVDGEEATIDSLLRGSLTELDENGEEKADGIKVESTVISPQYLKNDDQKNLFVGAKVDSDVVFNPNIAADGNLTELAAMLNVDKENADVKSDFKMHVTNIMVNAPADMNQEFFDNVLGAGQAKDEGEYFEKLKDILAKQLVNDSNYRFTIDAERILKDKVGELELPEAFLKRFLKSNNENLTDEQVEAEFPNAKSQLQWQLIKDKLASQLDVKIEKEDTMRLARFFAAQQFAQYGMTNLPDDVIDNYANKMLDEAKTREQIVERAFDDKFYAMLKDAVTLEEKNVSVDEFNALFSAEKTAE